MQYLRENRLFLNLFINQLAELPGLARIKK